MKLDIIKCVLNEIQYQTDDNSLVVTIKDEEGEHMLIAKDNEAELLLKNQNKELYLSILKGNNNIYELKRVANKEIYTQFNNLLLDYNNKKIDILYNDQTKSLLERVEDEYIPSINWSKEIEIEH